MLARQDVGPILDKAARKLAAGSAAVAAGRGRVPAARLGYSGQYLPSYTSVAAGIGTVATVMRGASDLVLPPPAPVQPLAFPDLLSLAPKTRRKAARLAEGVPAVAADVPAVAPPQVAPHVPSRRRARPAPLLLDAPLNTPEPKPEAKPEVSAEPPTERDPQLDAIRALLAEVQSIPSPKPAPKRRDEPAARIALVPRRPHSTRPAASVPNTPADTLANTPLAAKKASVVTRAAKASLRWIARRKATQAILRGAKTTLSTGSSAIIGWAATGIALPFAVVKTLMIHLNGQDLRRID